MAERELTPEQIAAFEKSRAKSDSELIEGGAEGKNGRLEITREQWTTLHESQDPHVLKEINELEGVEHVMKLSPEASKDIADTELIWDKYVEVLKTYPVTRQVLSLYRDAVRFHSKAESVYLGYKLGRRTEEELRLAMLDCRFFCKFVVDRLEEMPNVDAEGNLLPPEPDALYDVTSDEFLDARIGMIRRQEMPDLVRQFDALNKEWEEIGRLHYSKMFKPEEHDPKGLIERLAAFRAKIADLKDQMHPEDKR